MCPSRSAASIIDSGTRSLIEPPGLWFSSLRNRCAPPVSRRWAWMRGVLPIWARMEAIDFRDGQYPNFRTARGVVDVPLMARARFSRSSVTEDAVQAGGGGTLLGSISDFCRRTGMAESTFGRRAVNDGKFVARLRDGARVTPETLTRVNDFMVKHGAPGAGEAPPELMALIHGGAPRPAAAAGQKTDPESNFRFFDNRQKYLLFVNTCSEKDVIARRVGLELGQIHPRPPAVRLFDAGMGDGTVLARVMREMHRRFATVPFYIVGKEISLEDVRLSLRKMADRFFEHPATVLVVTNMYYSEAPWLTPRAVTAATSMVWHEASLTGTTSHEFSEQIAALEPFLAKNWQAKAN